MTKANPQKETGINLSIVYTPGVDDPSNSDHDLVIMAMEMDEDVDSFDDDEIDIDFLNLDEAEVEMGADINYDELD